MTLTVDTSVVIKWFVKEEGFEEARGLLAHRIHLHAPDLLLAEFANTIWKKVHRREIADPRPYFDELANLPDAVTLHRGGEFIDRAAEIAVETDHPVYDCLYLACAEATASALITADRQFAKKLAGRIPDVWHLGDPATAGRSRPRRRPWSSAARQSMNWLPPTRLMPQPSSSSSMPYPSRATSRS